MRRVVLGVVLATTLVTGAVSISPVGAQEFYFLKITSPVDKQNYAPGGTTNIIGVLRVPESITDKDSLVLRFRVFRPGNKAFVIMTESLLEVKNPPKGTQQVAFQGSLTLPKEEEQYLLRVDCLNIKIPDYPKSLVTSQSLFINVQTPKLKAGTRHTVTIIPPKTTDTYGTGQSLFINFQTPKLKDATHHTVTINTPTTTDSYFTGSGIGPIGTSTTNKVVQIRLRVVQDSTIMQESVVSVALGKFQGALTPPMGGWKKGNATLEARGLDSCGNEVIAEVNTVDLKIQ